MTSPAPGPAHLCTRGCPDRLAHLREQAAARQECRACGSPEDKCVGLVQANNHRCCPRCTHTSRPPVTAAPAPRRSPCCQHGCGPEDVECCICGGNPCDDALDDRARRVIEHHQDEMRRAREAHAREVAYVLEHGEREEPPF